MLFSLTFYPPLDMIYPMMVLIVIIKGLFTAYTLMLLGRVLGSWIPSLAGHPVMRFLAHYTDPYLNFFRKIIPPIGGVVDLSPILAFFALQLAQMLILKLFL